MAAAPAAMTIIYHKEDFLFTLFPELANGNNELIVSTLTAYYSYDNKQPKISRLGSGSPRITGSTIGTSRSDIHLLKFVIILSITRKNECR